jgi:branched-chain amino acid transport system substrate-binding protein
VCDNKSDPKSASFRRQHAWLVVMAVLVLLWGCSGPKASQSETTTSAAGETITIGSILPLSGPNAHYGEDNKAGMETALDEVNHGGIAFKDSTGVIHRYGIHIQYENSYGGPNNTLNASDQMEKLVTAGVPVVLGEHFSGVTLALAPIANARHRVLLTPCSTNYKLREAGPWVFRILPTDYDQSVRMARYGKNELKAGRAAVLNIENAYGRDLAKTFVDTFTADGGTIVYNHQFSEGQREFGGFIADLLRSKAQFLFLVGHTQEMADLLRTKDRIEKSQGRARLPVLGTDGMYDDTFLKQAGGAAEGIVLASAGFNPQSGDPIVQKFVAAFQAKFGRAPNLWSAGAYDALRVLAEAIRNGGTKPDGIRESLFQIRNFPGATGMNTIDKTGGTEGKPVYMFVIRNGKFEQIG